MGGKATFTPAFDAWRFYEDGTESGSSAIDAQNTNINRDVSAGNATCHLRVRIQETGGADGATTDDYGLQYQVNGAGGWTTITDASSRARAFTTSGLTDGGTTTNRSTDGITDGTGSFVAGEQEEANGVIEDRQLTASNFTEHVWALEIVSADNANADTLDFRITLNGGNPGMTNSVTPRITITKVTTYNEAVAESVGVADAPVSQANFNSAVAESVGVADAVSGFAAYADSVAESIGAADAVSALKTLNEAVAESAGIADQTSSQGVFNSAVAESAGVADAIVSQANVSSAIAESVGVADGVSGFALFSEAVAESVGVADSTDGTIASGTYFESVAESIGVADAPSSQMIAGVAVSEMASIVDAIVATGAGLPISLNGVVPVYETTGKHVVKVYETTGNHVVPVRVQAQGAHVVPVEFTTQGPHVVPVQKVQ